jgi:hypothetical protein
VILFLAFCRFPVYYSSSRLPNGQRGSGNPVGGTRFGRSRAVAAAMLKQYVLSPTPIVHSGLLEMPGVPSEKHGSTKLNEAMGASGWAGARPGRHNVSTTGKAREPIRWAGSASRKALACSRRGRDRSAARSTEDTSDVARTGSAGSPPDGATPISALTAVLALAAAGGAGIYLPSGPLHDLQELPIRWPFFPRMGVCS